LAMAGIVAAPAAFADTTVYGSLRLAETYNKPPSSVGGSNWGVTNHSSRLGFKGTEDLGNGLSAVYRYEFKVEAADGGLLNAGGANRLAYVGLKGGWGELTIGTQWNPYYFAVAGEVDIYAWLAGSAGGYYNNGGVTRSTNMLVYSSPSFSGFNFYGAVKNDGATGDNNIDQWQAAGIYDNGPLFIGAGYLYTSSAVSPNNTEPTRKSQKQYGVQARYTFGNFLLSGDINWNKQFGDTTNGWDIFGEYKFGVNRVYASYGKVQDGKFLGDDNNPFDDDERDKYKGWGVGFRHDLSNRSRLVVEYGQDKFGSDKFKQFSVGMRHDF